MPEAVPVSTASLKRGSSSIVAHLTDRRTFFSLVRSASIAVAVVASPAIGAPAFESEMVGIFREWAALARGETPASDLAFYGLFKRARNAEAIDARDEAAFAWMAGAMMFGGRFLTGNGMVPDHRATPLEDIAFKAMARHPDLAAIARAV